MNGTTNKNMDMSGMMWLMAAIAATALLSAGVVCAVVLLGNTAWSVLAG